MTVSQNFLIFDNLKTVFCEHWSGILQATLNLSFCDVFLTIRLVIGTGARLGEEKAILIPSGQGVSCQHSLSLLVLTVGDCWCLHLRTFFSVLIDVIVFIVFISCCCLQVYMTANILYLVTLLFLLFCSTCFTSFLVFLGIFYINMHAFVKTISFLSFKFVLFLYLFLVLLHYLGLLL